LGLAEYFMQYLNCRYDLKDRITRNDGVAGDNGFTGSYVLSCGEYAGRKTIEGDISHWQIAPTFRPCRQMASADRTAILAPMLLVCISRMADAVGDDLKDGTGRITVEKGRQLRRPYVNGSG
jgi:hypothetical protein